jgi:hypothetical protein
MHLKLDDEIVQIENRIAGRKQQLSYAGRATGKRTLDVLASPVTIAGALALGFAVGGGLGRKREQPPARRADDRTTKAKVSGIAGLAVSGAMWFVRQQFGGPVGLARFLADKFQHSRLRGKGAPREYPAREFPPRV